ncbi:helix-turn-helix transcriptional regulator [Hymenobacter sp. DG25A]|uniref:helix-turn-helix domain-containing protein n=1 Tax=Hymenobacter sp. DG25A TaxID=1385663 RepID=UPI000A732DC1|nr:helix-turn-helix transcriptional regulator [Hymenobacter sp. DG25A]
MIKEETIGQRFSQLIQELGMTKNAFAISLEKTATVIQHLVEERNKPGFDLLCKVFEVYPNVSKDWLMQGAGPMFSGSVHEAASPALAELAPQSFITAEVPAGPTTTTPEEPTSSVASPAASEKTTEQPTVPTPPAAIVSEPHLVGHPAVAANAAPATAPALPAVDTSWQTALYTQQMAHQLAMAELRNQHLQEQQRLMQQMMDLMQRQLVK